MGKADGVNVGGGTARGSRGSIDGLEIVNGKVSGEIPVDDFEEIRKISVHNAEGIH